MLFNALLKWIPARDRAAHGATAAAADISPAVIPPTNDLEAVAGLDVAGGVKRVLGKRDFYEKLVLGFATGEQIHSVETVRAQLAEGDRVAAERTAHSLKGVAGTIGMSELQQRATELESAIKESKDRGVIEAQLTSVDEELTRLVMAIKVATGIGEPPGLMARGEETVEELSAAAIERLGKLAEALEGQTSDLRRIGFHLGHERDREPCSGVERAGQEIRLSAASEVGRDTDRADGVVQHRRGGREVE